MSHVEFKIEDKEDEDAGYRHPYLPASEPAVCY